MHQPKLRVSATSPYRATKAFCTCHTPKPSAHVTHQSLLHMSHTKAFCTCHIKASCTCHTSKPPAHVTHQSLLHMSHIKEHIHTKASCTCHTSKSTNSTGTTIQHVPCRVLHQTNLRSKHAPVHAASPRRFASPACPVEQPAVPRQAPFQKSPTADRTKTSAHFEASRRSGVQTRSTLCCSRALKYSTGIWAVLKKEWEQGPLASVQPKGE